MAGQVPPQKLGQYEITEELGRGSFSTVYRSRHTRLNREVALKVLNPALMADDTFVARFENEARAVAQLDHAHIVTIYELGQCDGRWYIAMQLLPGGTLTSRIAADGPLPFDEAVRIVEDAAEALEYAHRLGYIHRDIKPANILFNARGEAVVTDFGLVKAVEASVIARSSMGGVVGTPAYIAPEVWEGGEAGPASDIYALGCVLYEMLVGTPLFQGSTPPAVMMAHFQPLRLPEAWPQGVPDGLGGLLERALARDPAGRFASAADLASELRALAAAAADPLAEPYRVLQAALGSGDWPQALTLAQSISAQDPGYRDVPALAQRAAEAQAREERTRWAAQWRQQALDAQNAGQRSVARVAAQRWLEMAPGDPEALAFARSLEAPPAESGQPAQPADQPVSRETPGRGRGEVRAPTPKRRRVWLLAGLAVVLLAAASVGVWLSRKQPDDQREPTSTVVARAGGGPDATPTATAPAVAELDATPALPDAWEYGVVLDRVTAGYPAEAAGFQVGDFVVAVDGLPVGSDPSELTSLLRAHRPGDSLTFWVVRSPGTDPFALTAQLVEHPTDQGVGYLGVYLGAALPKSVILGEGIRLEEWLVLGRGSISQVAVSPAGGTLAVVGGGGTWLYDVDTLDLLAQLPAPGNALSWSPDGSRLAVGGADGRLQVWDVSAGESVAALDCGGYVAAVAWSPGGESIACGGDGEALLVWDPRGLQVAALAGHEDRVESVAWSPDGKLLVSASSDMTLRVWDVATATQLRVLEGHTERVRSVAWSPDGKRIASGGAGDGVRVWDAQTGQSLQPSGLSEGYIMDLSWSSDGTQLVTANYYSGIIDVWDVSTWESQTGQWLDGWNPLSMSWRPDGSELAVANEDQVRIISHQMVRLRLLEGHTGYGEAVDWQPQGGLVASANGAKIRLWDAAGGRLEATLEGHTGRIMSMAWSPDGSQIASAGLDRQVILWDAAEHEALFRLRGHNGQIETVSWSPDGTQVASGGYDNTVQIWDARSGQGVHTIEGIEWVHRAVWSPDGLRMAIVGSDGIVRIWDAKAWQETKALEGHEGWLGAAAWSPDGSQLATAGQDRTVRIWDAESGEQLRALEDHGGVINGLDWSPDGSLLASTDESGELAVWDAVSGDLLQVAKGRESISWSPDGTRLVTDVGGGVTKIWRLVEPGGTRTTGEAPSPTPNAVRIGGLPPGVEVFPGEAKKAYSINLDHPNDRTVDVIDLYVQCLSCSRPDLRLTKGDGSYDDPVWSPDGTMIAVLRGTDCWTKQLVIVSSDGSWQHVVEGVLAMCRPPSWSPAGDAIAYNAPDGSLNAVDLASGEIRTIVPAAQIQNKNDDINDLSFSPDGSKLLFWTRMAESVNDEKGWEIWVVNADGSNLLNLREPDAEYGQMTTFWSADSKRIVYTRQQMIGDKRGTAETRIMDADGKNRRLLTGSVKLKLHVYYPDLVDCDPDGAWCYDYSWDRD